MDTHTTQDSGLTRGQFLNKTGTAIAGIAAMSVLPAALAGCASGLGGSDSDSGNGRWNGPYDEPEAGAPDPANWKRERVAVIGAGISGLGAARYLHDRGFDVTVLEAQGRVGGRMLSIDVGGVPVDFGASWIEGGADSRHPITRIARRLGIRINLDDSGELRAFRDGDRVSAGKLAAASRRFDSAWDELLEWREELDSDVPISAGLRHLSGLDPLTLALFQGSIEGEYGADFDQMSLWSLDEDYAYHGESYVVPGGYAQVPKKIARGLNVQLGRAVTRIERIKGGMRVSARGGRDIDVDRVIVTVPLPVLQRGGIEFVPQLPESKIDAFGSIAMGAVEKLAIKFPKAFWPSDANPLMVAQGAGASFVGWESRFAYDKDAPILTGFITGDAAREWAKLPQPDALEVGLDVLREAFGRKHVPKPDTSMTWHWTLDEHTRGSYSYVPTGSEYGDYASIARPVGSTILFAGEATHVKYPSTVHGAYLSGVREAKRVLELAATGGSRTRRKRR